MFWSVVTVFGLVALAKFVFNIVNHVLDMFRTFNPKSYGGGWAVVTGATDGIGRAYCNEFAKAGMNVVCISRTQAKLDQCVEELKKDYKVQAKSIQADFNTTDTDALYNLISEKLKGVDVGVLVNNVGASYDHAQYLDALPTEKLDSLIRMNVTSVTRMTHLVLPQMLQRKKGAIINVGSGHGTMKIGAPLYSLYSGNKAFVDMFSRSLNAEYASKGIFVQCHVPFLVTTKLSKVRKASFFAVSPSAYAESAVKCIGGVGSVVPVLSHKIQDMIVELLPTALLNKVVTGMHVGILKKALKKAALTKNQ